MNSAEGKVFGIGFQKTGTTSLHLFLKHLGLKSIHWPNRVNGIHYQKRCIPVLRDRHQVIRILQPVLDGYDAFTDVPFPALYRELAETRPEARFILIRRDVDDWWSSLARHWKLGGGRTRRLDPYEFLQYNQYPGRIVLDVSDGDGSYLRDLYVRHIDDVGAFFRSAPERLVCVDLDDPHCGGRIAEFLGLPCMRPFPRIRRRSGPCGAPAMAGWALRGRGDPSYEPHEARNGEDVEENGMSDEGERRNE